MHGPASSSEDTRPRVVAPSTWWAGFFCVVAIATAASAYAYAYELPRALIEGHRDKLWHFFGAGLLAFFLDGALQRRAIGQRRPIPLAALLVLAPAAIDEYMQRYAAVRESSLLDFAADVAGVALFTWLSRRVAR